MDIRLNSLEAVCDFGNIVDFEEKHFEDLIKIFGGEYQDIISKKDIGYLNFMNNKGTMLNITKSWIRYRTNEVTNEKIFFGKALNIFSNVCNVINIKNESYYLDMDYIVSLSEEEFGKFYKKFDSTSKALDFSAFTKTEVICTYGAFNMKIDGKIYSVSIQLASTDENSYKLNISYRTGLFKSLKEFEGYIDKIEENKENIQEFINNNII